MIEATIKDLPECSKEYCENFLREPAETRPWERACMLKDQCFALRMQNKKITAPKKPVSGSKKKVQCLREWLLPRENEQMETKKQPPEQPRHCYLCEIYFTNWQYNLRVQQHKKEQEENKTDVAISPFEIVQNFQHVIGERDFSKSDCLHPDPDPNLSRYYGLIAPFLDLKLQCYSLCTRVVDDQNILGFQYRSQGFRIAPARKEGPGPAEDRDLPGQGTITELGATALIESHQSTKRTYRENT